jgi:hydroxypyruvate isomerase
MVELSVCIEMFWRDAPMHERVRRVKALGYKAFEFWGWKSKDLASIREAQTQTGLACAAISMEPSSALLEPSNDVAVLNGFGESVKAACSLGCTRLICVPGTGVANESFEITRRRVLRKVRALAKMAEDAGMLLLLEPLNPVVDHKGVWLTRMNQAADLVLEVGSPNVRILCDLYHQQISEGNLLANFAHYGALVRHIHAAGVPGRHELVGGELDYRAIFSAIKKTGYEGYIGLEFAPEKEGDAGLKEALGLL